MEKFKGVEGSWKSSGLHILSNDGKFQIGQAFVIDFKHDWRGKSIEDIKGISNAKLMAAAPDLLEALQQLMQCYSEKGQLLSFDVNIAREAVNKALNQQ